MKLALTCFSLLLSGAFGIAQQPAQSSLQNTPAFQTSAPVSALQQRAATGDAQAQFELGRAYEDGSGVPQDDAKAVEWFRKSAEQGNAQAENSLGVMYALGRGVPRDREEAVRWYKKAAKLGSADGMYNVAISYFNGEGAEENTTLACTWMVAAQRKGDAQAAEALKHIEDQIGTAMGRCRYDLAGMYEKGDELPQDLPAALQVYTEEAQKDHKQSIFASEAQFKLCQLYAAGKGVPRDYAQARAWCKKSETPFSYVVLGRLAEKGLGGDKDRNEALKYYRDAAVLSVPDGIMECGRLESESGTHDGWKNAYFWYAIGVDRRFAGASEKLQQVAAQLSEKERAAAGKVVQELAQIANQPAHG